MGQPREDDAVTACRVVTTRFICRRFFSAHTFLAPIRLGGQAWRLPRSLLAQITSWRVDSRLYSRAQAKFCPAQHYKWGSMRSCYLAQFSTNFAVVLQDVVIPSAYFSKKLLEEVLYSMVQYSLYYLYYSEAQFHTVYMCFVAMFLNNS